MLEIERLKNILLEGEKNGAAIGQLLLYIQTQKLYKQAGYSNYGTFLNHEFGMTIRTSIRYVAKNQLCDMFPGFKDKIMAAPLTACDMLYKMYNRGFKIDVVNELRKPGPIKAKDVAQTYALNKPKNEARVYRMTIQFSADEMQEFNDLEKDIMNANPDDLRTRREIILAAMRSLGVEAAHAISQDQID